MMQTLEKAVIGQKVQHIDHKDVGVVVEIRTDGAPIVRWSYGNCLRSKLYHLTAYEGIIP